MSIDYYRVLNVDQNATLLQIKRAYRKLALRWHPDRVDKAEKAHAEKVFKEIVDAYYVLGHPQRRKDYDQQRKNPYNHPSQESAYSQNKGDQIYEDFIKKQSQNYGSYENDSIFGGKTAKVLAVISAVLFYSVLYFKFKVHPYWVHFISPAFLYIIFEPLRGWIWYCEDYFWAYPTSKGYESFFLFISWVIISVSLLAVIKGIF